MNIVDSSGWLEYFTDGMNAEYFHEPLNNSESLIIPTIIIYEVFKVILRKRNENEALKSIALMRQGITVDLTEDIAILAAQTSIEHNMPMADSIILATARIYNATVWTQDED
ncbi:type II toxin-antitoxin system VapC family toxin, partial [Candidatus Omnitrophota bacterium]